MRKLAGIVLGACALSLLLSAGVRAADEPAKAGGKWEMTLPGPQGPDTRELTIEQTGEKIKGTMKGRRGDTPFEGTVKANKISFTVKRQRPDGGETTSEYTGTIDGDNMKGTVQNTGGGGGGQGGGPSGPREWTAKRQK